MLCSTQHPQTQKWKCCFLKLNSTEELSYQKQRQYSDQKVMLKNTKMQNKCKNSQPQADKPTG